MSNLMEDRISLLSKLLQLERQIVFVQGYKDISEDIRYRQALPNIDRYLKSNKFLLFKLDPYQILNRNTLADALHEKFWDVETLKF